MWCHRTPGARSGRNCPLDGDSLTVASRAPPLEPPPVPHAACLAPVSTRHIFSRCLLNLEIIYKQTGDESRRKMITRFADAWELRES